MRTCASLRVILHREHRLMAQANPRDCVVVEMLMGNLHIRIPCDGIARDYETMILTGDFTLTGNQILNRMIDAAVTVEHLLGFQSLRESDELMTEANSEYRNLANKLFNEGK